ncbi:MAG TPA: hypothetical protein VN876_09285, partial [Gemmatimonadaceae bacterium]|nr:hypothetical protein [Gemmatimonadaceae bacterium]
MDRRDFVRLGAIASAVAVRGKPLAAETLTARQPSEAVLTGRRFSVPPSDLDEVTLSDLQAGMAAGRMTARSITLQYLDRIAALNLSGPALRHVLERNPDALS